MIPLDCSILSVMNHISGIKLIKDKYMRYLIFVLLTGCASTFWNERVGNYTFNEALRDYGPADSCRPIDTGKACTWSSGRNDRLILVFDRNNYLTAAEDD